VTHEDQDPPSTLPSKKKALLGFSLSHGLLSCHRELKASFVNNNIPQPSESDDTERDHKISVEMVARLAGNKRKTNRTGMEITPYSLNLHLTGEETETQRC
jgi:hypothetical protein